MSEPKTWWILFRRWETIVMESREEILKVYPNPERPEVNLICTVEKSYADQLQSKLDIYEKALEFAALPMHIQVSDKESAERRYKILEVSRQALEDAKKVGEK